MLPDDDTKVWLAAVHRRDAQALGKLAAQLEPGLLYLLRGKFYLALHQGWLHSHDLLAGLQEGLLAFWKEPGRVASVSELRGWLYRCASNYLISLLRKNQSYRNTVSDEELADDAGANPIEPAVDEVDETTPLQCLIHSENRKAIADCLSQLPSELEQTVLHGWVGGMSGKEIAATLEIPEGTVKSRFNRARQALQQCLRGKGIGRP